LLEREIEMDITPYATLSDEVTPAVGLRANLLVIATTLVSAALVIGYVSLLGYYLSLRSGVLDSGEQWLPRGVKIPLTQPNFMALTITFAVIAAWWSFSSVRNSDTYNAYLAYGLTFLFGAAYIGQSFYLISLMGLEAASGEAAALIYALIGFHISLVIAALAFGLVVVIRTFSGDFVSGNSETVLGSAIFWTAVGLSYAILWYGVYITK
jgi:heme/copper-type cytochrome/quinol oxidase subunit 3